MDKEALSKLEYGYISNYISVFQNGEIYSCFYLKEQRENINNIIDFNTVEMKSTMAKIDGQPSFILLFKFFSDNKFIYGRAYKKENKSDRENLEVLLFQKDIPLVFVDFDNNIVKTVVIENEFKENIKSFIKSKRNTPCIELYNLNNRGYNLKNIWLKV